MWLKFEQESRKNSLKAVSSTQEVPCQCFGKTGLCELQSTALLSEEDTQQQPSRLGCM